MSWLCFGCVVLHVFKSDKLILSQPSRGNIIPEGRNNTGSFTNLPSIIGNPDKKLWRIGITLISTGFVHP
jgi:hypothetical protein